MLSNFYIHLNDKALKLYEPRQKNKSFYKKSRPEKLGFKDWIIVK